MDNHPVLLLLSEGEAIPPQRSFQHAANVIAKNPNILSELTRKEVSEALLDLVTLSKNVKNFTRLLLMLSRALVAEKSLYSSQIALFMERLAKPLSDILSQSKYYDLLCAAMQLCSSRYHRWKFLRAIAACGQALEWLSASFKGHAIVRTWAEASDADGFDSLVLEDWVQRMVTLIEACSNEHRSSLISAKWRRLQTLRHKLQQTLIDDREAMVNARDQVSETHSDKANFENDKIALFADFGIPVPKSYRMCKNTLDLLSCNTTLSVLRDILATYPCPLCQDYLKSGIAFPQGRSAMVQQQHGSILPEKPFDIGSDDIGEWRLVLSSKAYQDLRRFERDANILKILKRNFAELATGNAKSGIVRLKKTSPRIALWLYKCHPSSNILVLWQIDLAHGPELGMEQQVVKIWTVGTREMVWSMVEQIFRYQKNLSDITVSRCAEKSQYPKAWDRRGSTPVLQSRANLDIQLMDLEFIDAFNKSFTITNTVLQSIIDQDLAAEFPFDLSSEEMCILRHFESPTLILGRSGTGKTTCLLFKMIAKYLANYKASDEQAVRQVFLTRSETLADKLQSYARRLIATLSRKELLPRMPGKEEASEQRTLLQLGQHDFPLVCTYDHFLLLVDNTICSLKHDAAHDALAKSRPRLVNFKDFRTKYWPHFSRILTKRLSPELVFSDIMGVIKGSVDTCKDLKSLQLESYKTLSSRVAPNVTSEQDKDKIFEIFGRYEKIKGENEEIDTVDWVRHLLQQMRSKPNLRLLLASCVDEMYVDEVQDQRCIDVALMLELGHDPRNFHFGGDTAQAISQDSVFRFQDVKCLFYDHFLRQSVTVGQKTLAQPRLFTLNRNYRSHQGILSLASSVMELLWMNFPNTVDKLEPEIGSLIGPIPIIFLKCDTSVLVRAKADASVAADHELLFGAEQVILVRDDIAKAELKKEIGDIGLILTILQAKGMEFDDVILWDFLSTTPDPAGWRNLQETRYTPSLQFDALRHASLCSELKHLYVAITRARVRFSMIERFEDAARSFVDVMGKESTMALLEVTLHGSTDFDQKITFLQPRKSDDPYRWRELGEHMMSQGSYPDACVCFRRAKDPLKEKEAYAYLEEAKAEVHQAQGRTTEARTALEVAALTFQEINLISHAVRLLVQLKRHEDAANLWFAHGNFELAAPLYEMASNHLRASQAWDSALCFDKAITSLKRGAYYDDLVLYFAKVKDLMTDHEIKRHQRVVKLLLKQKKITHDHEELAIQLFGSFAEQEAFFLEYELNDRLLELYTSQQAIPQALKLLIKLDRLEEAFQLMCSSPGLGIATIGEARLSQIIPIIWVDRIQLTTEHTGLALEGDSFRHWKMAHDILHGWDPLITPHTIQSMKDGSVVKEFLCLYITIQFGNTIKVLTFDEAPFEIILQAVKFVKTQQSEPRGPVGKAIMLLCGVSSDFAQQHKYSLRAWSPLYELNIMQDRFSLDIAALRFTFDQVTKAVFRVHELAIALFRAKWPTTCNYFLSTGNCKFRDQSNGCPYEHELVTTKSYSEVLNDLLRIINVLCETTTLYYRRVMSDDISSKFLKARRRWLEELLTRLSYVSALERDTTVLKDVLNAIQTENSLRPVASCLEDNLLYKARDEWKRKADLGYVLEQLQFVGFLGHGLKPLLIRITRRLLQKYHASTYGALVLLDRLQRHMKEGHCHSYCDSLAAFLNVQQGIRALSRQNFDVFHCYTALFESIALYLLLQICQSAIIIPRSWLDLHLDDILKLNGLLVPPDFEERSAYGKVLSLLLKTFADLLVCCDKTTLNHPKFVLCGRDYPMRMLQQRNAELLAVITVNFPSNLRSADFMNHWQAVVGTFELNSVKARYLLHRVGNADELRNRLLESHSRYEGKNPLVIVRVTNAPNQSLNVFQAFHNLQSLSLAALRSRSVPLVPINEQTVSDRDRSDEEQNAALCIQRHWRKLGARITSRRLFAITERGRIIARLHAMAFEADIGIRSILFDLGEEALAKIVPHDLLIADFKKRAFEMIETDKVEDFEAFDSLLEAITMLEDGVKSRHNRLSEESLISLIHAKNEIGLATLLRGELKQMAEEELDVGKMTARLDLLSK